MPATYSSRIDGLTTSVAVKAPVRIATDTPITLSGEQTIDGVVLSENLDSVHYRLPDRVLVMGQVDKTTNGIYEVRQGRWTRAGDFDGARDAVDGTLVIVSKKDDENGVIYVTRSNDDPIIFGTSEITFQTAASYFAASPASILLFGGDPSGTTESTTAFVNMLGSGLKEFYLPYGTYIINPMALSGTCIKTPKTFKVSAEPGTVIKLQSGILTNGNTVGTNIKNAALFRTEGGDGVYWENIIFDGNRENQLYPLTLNNVNPGGKERGVVEVTSDGVNFGKNIHFTNCQFINGYTTGAYVFQCEDVTFHDCVAKNNTINGFAIRGSHRVWCFAPNTSYNGAYERSTPDNGWSSTRNTADRGGFRLRYVVSSTSYDHPVVPATLPNYGGNNQDIWIIDGYSYRDSVEFIWAGGCERLHIVNPTIVDVGYLCKSSPPRFRPAALWLEHCHESHVDSPTIFQPSDNTLNGDLQPDGIVAVAWIGEQPSADDGNGTSQPDGEYNILITNPLMYSGEDFDGITGNWEFNTHKKNNLYKFFRLSGHNIKVEGGSCEGACGSQAIDIINPHNATDPFGYMLPRNVHVDGLKIRNVTALPLVTVRRFGGATVGDVEGMYFNLDVADIRSIGATSENRYVFAWGSDMAPYKTKDLVIDGRYDLTQVDNTYDLVGLLNFRGNTQSTVNIDGVVRNAAYLFSTPAGWGRIALGAKGLLTENVIGLVSQNAGSQTGGSLDLYNVVATGLSTFPFRFNSSFVLDNLTFGNVRLEGTVTDFANGAFVLANCPRNVSLGNLNINKLTTAYTPAAISDGGGSTVSIAGNPLVQFGAYAQGAYTDTLQGMMFSTYITAQGAIRNQLENETGGSVTLAAGGFRNRVRRKRENELEGSGFATLNTITAGSVATFTITVTGARLGDFVVGIAGYATMAPGNVPVMVDGAVTATDTVTVTVMNQQASSAVFGSTPIMFKALVLPLAAARVVGSITYNPPASLSDGDGVTSDAITVTDLQLGDYVLCSYSLSTSNVATIPYANAAGEGRVRFQNESGTSKDLTSGTIGAGTLRMAIDRL